MKKKILLIIITIFSTFIGIKNIFAVSTYGSVNMSTIPNTYVLNDTNILDYDFYVELFDWVKANIYLGDNDGFTWQADINDWGNILSFCTNYGTGAHTCQIFYSSQLYTNNGNNPDDRMYPPILQGKTLRINLVINGNTGLLSSSGNTATLYYNFTNNQTYNPTGVNFRTNNDYIWGATSWGDYNPTVYASKGLIINTITYNPNYLEDNPNFQSVCLNNQNQSFSIIPNTYDISSDFDISSFFLTSSYLQNISMNVLEFDSTGATQYLVQGNFDWDTYPYYKLAITDDILSGGGSISDKLVFNIFKQVYPILYPNLYGYSLFLTKFQHQASTGLYILPVFRLEDAYTLDPYCVVVGGSTICETATGQQHGGGGRVPGGTINEPSQETCFYIPIDTHLKVWQMDDFNDISDIINIGGIDININTDSYEEIYLNDINSNNYSGFVGYIQQLLKTCSTPITFITSKFTLLFQSLPLNLQYLIIGLISLGFLIGIIKFLTGGK